MLIGNCLKKEKQLKIRQIMRALVDTHSLQIDKVQKIIKDNKPLRVSVFKFGQIAAMRSEVVQFLQPRILDEKK